MIATLLRVALQLRRDGDRPDAELRARDRAIGRRWKATRDRPVRALRDWVASVAHEDDRARFEKMRAGWRAIGLALSVLGFLFGMGTAAAVYSYDGSQPINILPALAVFVVVPVFLLVPLLVQMLPLRTPGLEGLRDLLAAFGEGVLVPLTRRLGQGQRELLARSVGTATAHQRVYARLQRWTVMGWSQLFAVAFHFGAVAWFLGRVLVTDLGFTWSTTAEFVTPERVHAFTSLLSLPWQQWWPQAVPSLTDVQATQYFRLGEGSLSGATDPAVLGRWWTFLLAAMITYGWLPRALALGMCAVGRRRAARWTLLHLPGVEDALDRLTRREVLTRSEQPEPAAASERVSQGGTADTSASVRGEDDVALALGTPAILVRWSRLEIAEATLDRALEVGVGLGVEERFDAGAGRTLEEDGRVREEVGRAVAARERAAVVVAVKAWEPATMDAVDFVQELRSAVGEGTRIVVAALRLHGEQDLAHGDRDVVQWRRRMATLGDPWLRVVGLSASATETATDDARAEEAPADDSSEGDTP